MRVARDPSTSKAETVIWRYLDDWKFESFLKKFAEHEEWCEPAEKKDKYCTTQANCGLPILGPSRTTLRVRYLKGISTGCFGEALQSLLGPNAKGLSQNVIVRLKDQWSQEYDDWSRRDLTQKVVVDLL